MNEPDALSRLELKVPPAAVTLLFALAMWGVSKFIPTIELPLDTLIFQPFLVLASAAFGISGVLAFKKAGTTVHPMTPEKSRTLVVEGVFRLTRNPMYLALFLLLLALAFALSNPASFVLACLFIPYMNRFQIVPEERAMEKLFGEQFGRYREEVRRWI